IGQISEALKELVSKGFVAVFKHTGPYGAQATSSYFLLDAAPKEARAARPPWPAKPKLAWQPPRLERRTPLPARVSPPYDPANFPPLGPVMSSAPPPPDPFEASEKRSARDIHAQLDQIELSCSQEQREAEEEEAEEESEEATGREADNREQELRAALETLTKECNQAYCRMASSAWGTRERDESKQRLMRLREEQQEVRMQLHRLQTE
ncbi:MAG TPA: hypothetical protein VH540_08700, partial [Ktedonobacterales bacterium]